MEHIAAFILAIGCSPDLAECRELPAPIPVYETIEDCNADLPQVRRGVDGAYPRVFVSCFEVDPLLAEVDAEIVWDVTPDGILTAAVEPIEPDEVLVASEAGRSERDAVFHR